jgi:hypothetical protein
MYNPDNAYARELALRKFCDLVDKAMCHNVGDTKTLSVWTADYFYD